MATTEVLLSGLITIEKLNQKITMFQQSKAFEKIFQDLKKRFTTAQFFTLLEVTQGFVVYCGISRFRLGCILEKNDKVITYASRQLKVHKMKSQPMNQSLLKQFLPLTYDVTTCMEFMLLYSLITRGYYMCSHRKSLILAKADGYNCSNIVTRVFISTQLWLMRLLIS